MAPAYSRGDTDLDVSGGKLKRPGLDALLQRLRDGETGGIAVARLDRLSRAGVADALKLVEGIHELGGAIAAIDLGIDPLTPFGEFAMTVTLGLARNGVPAHPESGTLAVSALSRAACTLRPQPPPAISAPMTAGSNRTLALPRVVRERVRTPRRWRSLGGTRRAIERARGARRLQHWTVDRGDRRAPHREPHVPGGCSPRRVRQHGRDSALVPAAVWHAAQQARGAAVTRSVQTRRLQRAGALRRLRVRDVPRHRPRRKQERRCALPLPRYHSAEDAERAYAHAWELEAFVALGLPRALGSHAGTRKRRQPCIWTPR